MCVLVHFSSTCGQIFNHAIQPPQIPSLIKIQNMQASAAKMQLVSKTPSSLSLLLKFALASSTIFILYLVVSIFLVNNSKPLLAYYSKESEPVHSSTTLQHLVFGIASSNKLWPHRKEYIKLWWKPQQMRGCVFFDSVPEADNNSTNGSNSSLPPLCASADTSGYRYTYRGGPRQAIRIARVIMDTLALNHSDVRWLVFGEDDTVFFPENLVRTLGKYDHKRWFYIGAQSEIQEQNKFFGFGTAFTGAGFAISYPLAKALAKVFDSCLNRYQALYGSESRVSYCLADLGVGLTREPGFHEFDVTGNAFGLLAAHPLSPLVSMHHIDYLDPIFPNMTRTRALELLIEAKDVDSERILQLTVCYDHFFSWTIQVSWGYAIQVHSRHLWLSDILPAQETFRRWKREDPPESYTLHTKPVPEDPCQRPSVFFLDTVSSGRAGITTVYKKTYENCTFDATSPKKLEKIRVFSQKMELTSKQLWAPRRQCCEVLDSSAGKVMDIAVRECKEDEAIYVH